MSPAAAAFLNLLMILLICSILLPSAAEYIASGFVVIWSTVRLILLKSKSNLQSHLAPLPPACMPLFVGLTVLILTMILTTGYHFFFPAHPVPSAKLLKEAWHLIAKSALIPLGLCGVLSVVYRTSWQLKRSAPILSVGLVCYLLYTIAQRYYGMDWVHGFDAVLPPNRFDNGVYRVSGFMGHPLSLAYNLNLLTAILAGWIVARYSVSADKIWVRVCFVSACTIILISGSRWPLALMIMPLLAALTAFIFRMPKKYQFLAAISAFVLLGIAAYGVSGRFLALSDPNVDLEAKIPRLVFWKVHWNIFSDHPWFGAGVSAIKSLRLDYYDLAGYTNIERKYAAHNIYLQIAADSGLIGLSGLFIFFGSCFIAIQRLRSKIGPTVFLLTALAAGLMQNVWRDTEFIFCFWLLLLLSLFEQENLKDR